MQNINMFLSRLKNQNKAAATVRVYGIALHKYFSFLEKNNFPEEPDAVEKFLVSLEVVSAATQKLYFNAIKSYYKFQKNKLVEKIEYRFRKGIRNEKKFYEKDEIKKIIEYFEKKSAAHYSYVNIRNELFIKLAIITGARPSELLNLNMNDIRFTDTTIYIYFRNTKTKTDRIFPVLYKTDRKELQKVALSNQATKQMLISYKSLRDVYLKQKEKRTNALFVSGKGNRLSYLQVHKFYAKAMKELGLAGTPHWLRHSFVTQKLEEGAPVVAVANLVGHSSASTTLKIYAHTSERMLEKITYNNMFK